MDTHIASATQIPAEIELKLILAITHYRQLDELVHDYFKRTKASDNVPELDMDWPAYIDFERHGKLLVVGAYDDKQLVGFVMYFINKNPHHRTLTNAWCDILAVRPEYRGRHLGRHLMAVAEKRMRDLNVNYINHQFRVDYEVEPLFGKVGYELIERTYRKRIA